MSKGSRRRPAAVDELTLAQRWAAINWNMDNEDLADAPTPREPTAEGTEDDLPTVPWIGD